MQKKWIFVDESGDQNLCIQRGASLFYVLAGVVVNDEHVGAFLESADQLRRRYFQAGEIKSSKIGRDVVRRLRILSCVKQTFPPFAVVAYRVSKSLINPGSGLRFPQSFLKFFARDFCRHIPSNGQAIVAFDEKGRQSFKNQFVLYLEREFRGDDLFPSNIFQVTSSHDSVGIQVADLFAGSIAKLTDPVIGEKKAELQSILSQFCFVWDHPRPRLWGDAVVAADRKIDSLIQAESLRKAVEYVERAGPDNDDALSRREFLKILVDHLLSGEDSFIPSGAMEERLSSLIGRPLNSQTLRNKIVGPLRDEGVLISSKASKPDPGYKLPTSLRDIEGYIELTEAQVVPALRRVRVAGQVVHLVTGGEVDPLGKSRFDRMQRLAQIVDDIPLTT